MKSNIALESDLFLKLAGISILTFRATGNVRQIKSTCNGVGSMRDLRCANLQNPGLPASPTKTTRGAGMLPAIWLRAGFSLWRRTLQSSSVP
jgi:hypothetical protein